MKSLVLLLLSCFLLVGCSQAAPLPEVPNTETVTESVQTPEPMNIVIYHGNDNADGFESSTFEVYHFNSATLVEKLTEIGVLTDEVVLQSEEYDGSCLRLDFNAAFRNLVCSTGTSGEYMIIGSVVNTFLHNYNDVAESVFITVNGDILESGHVIYDFELTMHE